ncbi:hypothetical protein MHYP_G00064830 [Metynnis hypsauchen]
MLMHQSLGTTSEESEGISRWEVQMKNILVQMWRHTSGARCQTVRAQLRESSFESQLALIHYNLFTAAPG